MSDYDWRRDLDALDELPLTIQQSADITANLRAYIERLERQVEVHAAVVAAAQARYEAEARELKYTELCPPDDWIEANDALNAALAEAREQLDLEREFIQKFRAVAFGEDGDE